MTCLLLGATVALTYELKVKAERYYSTLDVQEFLLVADTQLDSPEKMKALHAALARRLAEGSRLNPAELREITRELQGAGSRNAAPR